MTLIPAFPNLLPTLVNAAARAVALSAAVGLTLAAFRVKATYLRLLAFRHPSAE